MWPVIARRAAAQTCLDAPWTASEGCVEDREPAGDVGLDRQLLLQLCLQLQLPGIVALLVLAARDERPERRPLVAVDQVHGILVALELEDGREQPVAEAARLQLRADQVDGRDEVL